MLWFRIRELEDRISNLGTPQFDMQKELANSSRREAVESKGMDHRLRVMYSVLISVLPLNCYMALGKPHDLLRYTPKTVMCTSHGCCVAKTVGLLVFLQQHFEYTVCYINAQHQ